MLSILILLSNDIHPNPGPLANDDISNSSYHEVLNSGLSILHLNIQSLKPKIDILEVEAQPYDILVLTETWLSSEVQNQCLFIPNYGLPFRCDRKERHGGGVAVYVRDGLKCKERKDLFITGLEALWLEIIVNNRKILIGGFYKHSMSTNTRKFTLW